MLRRGLGGLDVRLGFLESEVISVSLEDAAEKWLGGNTVFTETGLFRSKFILFSFFLFPLLDSETRLVF